MWAAPLRKFKQTLTSCDCTMSNFTVLPSLGHDGKHRPHRWCLWLFSWYKIIENYKIWKSSQIKYKNMSSIFYVSDYSKCIVGSMLDFNWLQLDNSLIFHHKIRHMLEQGCWKNCMPNLSLFCGKATNINHYIVIYQDSVYIYIVLLGCSVFDLRSCCNVLVFWGATYHGRIVSSDSP